MKKLNILPVFIFLYSFLQAQLPPPCGTAGDEPPGCVLCGPVYAGSTGGFNPDLFATDFCGTIENNQWLSFVAGATSATVSITAFNCRDTLGVEMALYDLNFNKVSNCFTSGGQNIPGSVTANGLTPGEVYLIVVDGYEGDVCNIVIQLVGVITSGPPDPPGPITGNPAKSNYCPGEIVEYSIPFVNGATDYTWSVPAFGNILAGQGTRRILVQWNNTGSGTIRCTAANPCFPQGFSLFPVAVINSQPIIYPPVFYCPGELPPQINQNTFDPGICDSVLQFSFLAYPEVTGFDSLRLCNGAVKKIGTNVISDSGQHQITLPDATVHGCDSVLMLKVDVENTIEVSSDGGLPLNCDGSGCTQIVVSLAQPNPNLSFEWSTEEGIIQSGANSLTPTVCLPGEYVLTFLDNQTQTSCVVPVLVERDGFLADPSFSMPDNTCSSQPVEVEFTGTAPPDAEFLWDFGSGRVLSGSGAGPYQIKFNRIGLEKISLQIKSGNCLSDIESKWLTVGGGLYAPVLQCEPKSDRIEYYWNVAGNVDFYEITSSAWPPDSVLITQNNSLTLTGLMPEETVTLTVNAVGQNPECFVETTNTCTTRRCLNFEIPQTERYFCVDQPAIFLPYVLDTTCVWTGQGVINNRFFSPFEAGLGAHTLTFQCRGIGSCIESGDRIFHVKPRPVFGANIEQPIWFGGLGGKIELTSPGYEEVEVKWQDGNITGETRTQLGFGEYCMEAFDRQTGCRFDTCFDIGLGFYKISPVHVVCKGSSKRLSVLPATGASFHWEPAAGLSCTDCPNPVASPVRTTSYKVTATLPDGRSETTNVLVIVLPPPFCRGLAAQVEQSEFDDFESFQKAFKLLEIPENPQESNEVLIYPNPAGDFIKILSGQNIRSVQLTDVSGRLVLNQQAAASSFELDTSRMPEGVYILKIDFENGTATFEKVVLSH